MSESKKRDGVSPAECVLVAPVTSGDEVTQLKAQIAKCSSMIEEAESDIAEIKTERQVVVERLVKIMHGVEPGMMIETSFSGCPWVDVVVERIDDHDFGNKLPWLHVRRTLPQGGLSDVVHLRRGHWRLKESP